MNDMVCFLNVDTEPNSNRGEDDDSKSGFSLKCLDSLLATKVMSRRCAGITVDDVGIKVKLFTDVVLKQALNIFELTKNNRL